MSKNKAKKNKDYPLGDRLRYLRERREFSQQALAAQSGVSQSTIAQIESGRKDPSITTLKKLALALDVHIAVLFSSDDVLVFDMERLKKRYKSVDDLNATLYMALGKVLAYARGIGFIS